MIEDTILVQLVQLVDPHLGSAATGTPPARRRHGRPVRLTPKSNEDAGATFLPAFAEPIGSRLWDFLPVYQTLTVLLPSHNTP